MFIFGFSLFSAFLISANSFMISSSSNMRVSELLWANQHLLQADTHTYAYELLNLLWSGKQHCRSRCLQGLRFDMSVFWKIRKYGKTMWEIWENGKYNLKVVARAAHYNYSLTWFETFDIYFLSYMRMVILFATCLNWSQTQWIDNILLQPYFNKERCIGLVPDFAEKM